MNTKNIQRIVLASNVESKVTSSANNQTSNGQLDMHAADVPLSNYDAINIQNGHVVSPDPPGGYLPG